MNDLFSLPSDVEFALAVAAGAQMCVVGSAIFKRDDPLAAMAEIRSRAGSPSV
jgi:pentose-5-phosphate-3-epimerase